MSYYKQAISFVWKRSDSNRTEPVHCELKPAMINSCMESSVNARAPEANFTKYQPNEDMECIALSKYVEFKAAKENHLFWPIQCAANHCDELEPYLREMSRKVVRLCAFPSLGLCVFMKHIFHRAHECFAMRNINYSLRNIHQLNQPSANESMSFHWSLLLLLLLLRWRRSHWWCIPVHMDHIFHVTKYRASFAHFYWFG